jgi:hypothetical protein
MNWPGSMCMTEILCRPAQGVPGTWFLGCISSCSAPRALHFVTRDSSEFKGSELAPRMSIGGVLEKLLGLWSARSGTAKGLRVCGAVMGGCIFCQTCMCVMLDSLIDLGLNPNKQKKMGISAARQLVLFFYFSALVYICICTYMFV